MFGELRGIERLDLRPVAVETLRPGIEGQRVVPPQVLDIEHFEAGLLHRGQGLRQAWDPSAGKDVLADVELGVVHPEVPNEVQHADAPGLEALRVRAHHFVDLIASRVLQGADGYALVVDARNLPEVRVHRFQRALQAPAGDFPAHPLELLARGVDPGAERLAALPGVEREAAPPAADVHESLAGFEVDLAAHVLHLVLLRFFQRRGAFLPVTAGVHHVRIVEPIPVELGSQGVVELRVGPGLRDGAVVETKFMPVVAQGDERIGSPVEPRIHAGAERSREIAFDVERLVEIGLEQPDVPEQPDAPLGRRGAKYHAHYGLAILVLEDRSVGEYDAEADARSLSDGAQGAPGQPRAWRSR